MDGHKDKDGKFHPHSDSSSKLSSHQVESSKQLKVNHKNAYKIKNKKTENKAELRKVKQVRHSSMVNPEYGVIIANAYDDLENNPSDPEVKKAYDTFINETIKQAEDIQDNRIEFVKAPTNDYDNVGEMIKDLEDHNYILYRPSDDDYNGVENHPMFKMSNVYNTDGEKMRVNDVFRVVHDINGHYKSGKAPFTAKGEQEAFLEHKSMYSPEAIKALFTETQGQGMWVNFNKKTGKKNRDFQDVGNVKDLDFAEQKADLYPEEIIF